MWRLEITRSFLLEGRLQLLGFAGVWTLFDTEPLQAVGPS